MRVSLSLMVVLATVVTTGCVAPDRDADGRQAAEVGEVTPDVSFTLTVTSLENTIRVTSPGGVVTVCTGDLGSCVFTYPAGTSLLIAPSPATNTVDCLQFASWLGTCAGQGVSCSLVINSDSSATARWGRINGCIPK